MRRRKPRAGPRPSYLKVIEGQGRGETVPAKAGMENRGSQGPVYFLLFSLASILIVQMLIGWVWGPTTHSSLHTVSVVESKADISFPISGIITFKEKVLLAPCAGFVYYNINGGQRVPVDKELAIISASPLEKEAKTEGNGTAGAEASLQRFKGWFWGEEREEGQDRGHAHLSPIHEEVKIYAPEPGLVSLNFEGLEGFGPQGGFPYFSAKELQDKVCPADSLRSGDRVCRSQPLLKIIDNYYWYYSVVLPRDPGQLIAEKPKVKFYFSFAPETPVWGEQVELKENDTDGTLLVTWRIDREIPGLYNQRCCKAEIVYEEKPGVLVPKSALVEAGEKQGVYYLEKGAVHFREIELLLEKGEDVFIKSWDGQQRIIANPESVKEGQRFRW
ncbi:MAG: hypothetical protein GX989_03170 [Firmicutes bacterium]|nr:hypothetical protein [Bacillota bacterium]